MFSFLSSKQKRVYLDNAGATPVSKEAAAALVATLGVFGNPSAIHKEGDKASQLLQQSRNKVATALNAHSYEVTFTGTGTESCNMAIFGTIEASSVSKPHIITSLIEHPSVLEPIRHLEKEGKVRVTYLPVYENGIVRVQEFKEALCEDTVLVSVMYANNEVGTLQPVKEIGRALDEWKREHERSFTAYPYFHIDACQAANYCNLDVVRLKCHLMTVNSSKVYGPKGVAALYKREGVKLSPTIYGGGQERGIRSGTEAVALAASFATALREAQELKEQESTRLTSIRDFFFEQVVQKIPDVTIYGDKKERLPNNINIRVPGVPSDEMILRLDVKGFAVSHKSACASQETDGSYVIQALGATEAESLENIRITLGRDTTKRDMEALINAIQEIQTTFGK